MLVTGHRLAGPTRIIEQLDCSDLCKKNYCSQESLEKIARKTGQNNLTENSKTTFVTRGQSPDFQGNWSRDPWLRPMGTGNWSRLHRGPQHVARQVMVAASWWGVWFAHRHKPIELRRRQRPHNGPGTAQAMTLSRSPLPPRGALATPLKGSRGYTFQPHLAASNQAICSESSVYRTSRLMGRD